MDEGQINQVIHNLVINAIQAMPQGGSIFIHGSNVEIGADENIALRSGNYVKISFRDTGSGIPKRNLSRIFDPYFTTKEKGSGLGLATCYSVIKKHDGLLNVSSELGVGTEFSFYLPASEPVNTISEPRKDICALRKPRILIMDDEKLIRDLASELLQAFGFDTELANDGSEAITLYEQALQNGNRFDLVLMDLTIPGGMGGKEAIRRLLLLDPGIRAVVSSGYCNDPVMADYESYGFLGILPKPYNIDQLTGLLKHLFPEHPMS
jgi:CheY-like chemotaxis protein